MHSHVDYKAPDGKLIRLDADLSGDLIVSIHIHGDFFIYPEESIVDIERCLIRMRVGETRNVKDRLDALIEERKIRMIGLTAQDLAEAIRRLF